jgi:hypothetical protein
MAWIEQHRRADGGLTARVIWRPGGARDTTRVWETFGAGSDAQNLARADGFKRMVEAAGQRSFASSAALDELLGLHQVLIFTSKTSKPHVRGIHHTTRTEK